MTERSTQQPPESLEELQELVGLQLRAGAFGAASIVLNAYLEKKPDESWAQAELCRCLLRLDKRAEAARVLDFMRKQSGPDDPEVLGLEGLTHQLAEETVQARSKYEAALASEPMLPWVAYNLARIAAEQGDDATCERWLDALIDDDPGHFAARFQRALLYGRTERPQETLDELVNTINANPLMLQPYLMLSELRLRDGKADQSIEVLVHGLQANPLAHALREAMARVFATQGDVEAAFGVRLELCRLRGRPEDYLDLGVAALLMESNEHAVVAFTKAINEAPKDWRGYYNLGEIHRAAGDYKGALPLYEKALSCETCDRTLNALALWHMEAPGFDGVREGQASPERALSLLQQALELSPEMPEALFNRVLALAQLSRPQEAEAALEELRHKLPETHPLHGSIPQLEEALATLQTQ